MPKYRNHHHPIQSCRGASATLSSAHISFGRPHSMRYITCNLYLLSRHTDCHPLRPQPTPTLPRGANRVHPSLCRLRHQKRHHAHRVIRMSPSSGSLWVGDWSIQYRQTLLLESTMRRPSTQSSQPSFGSLLNLVLLQNRYETLLLPFLIFLASRFPAHHPHSHCPLNSKYIFRPSESGIL